jgi:hypothetical protein
MLGERRKGVRSDRYGDLMAGVESPDDVAGDLLAGQQRPAGAADGDAAHVDGQRPQIVDGEGRSGRAHDADTGTIGAVSLARIAWLATVAVAIITGLIVLLNGYTGYGILSFVVGASAAINLR